jgi:hypothetical protein
MSMSRTEIRRRALRAATAVTLSMGFMGCAANVIVDTDETSGDEQAVVDDTPGTTEVTPPEVVVPEPAVTVEFNPKAFGPIVDCSKAPDYLACCEEHNWSFEAGCMAWGPPMPPAMGVA